MKFNRFTVNIIVRSGILAITALLIAFLSNKPNWLFTFIFLWVLFVAQIILLIRYTSKVNRDLANFIIHLKEQNTSLNLSSKKIEHLFSGLGSELNKINEEFKKIESEKIRKQNLLDILLNRIGTGILALNKSNNIIISNQALLNLLGIDNDQNKEDIKSKVFSLLSECTDLKIGNQQIVNTRTNNITRRILITLTEIKEEKESLRIYSFHDIDREITDYELQSWNGLIKVLSHEIMNTLTPMSTTVDTLKDCLTINGQEKKNTELNIKDIRDAIKGTNLLENRIAGLQNFIKKFREFLDIPVPELKPIIVNDIINNILETYKNQNIDIVFKPTSKDITILVDKDLIELVLINIIKNSLEANSTQILINTYTSNKQTIIEIKDNGSGIESSILNKIFLPFYTTKEKGSGIGLSLARQIMFAHKGNIKIQSSQQGETVLLLIFD